MLCHRGIKNKTKMKRTNKRVKVIMTVKIKIQRKRQKRVKAKIRDRRFRCNRCRFWGASNLMSTVEISKTTLGN